MISDVERIYSTSSQDLGFGAVLGACPPNDDESLAELIEADGRLRLRKGKTVDLERYLTEVPDLPQHPDALDAAIDVTLRGLSGSTRINPDAVESLIRRYPALAESIREAAMLNAAIWSTSGLRQRVTPPPARQMPCEFGPRLLSGQRRYVLEKFLGQGSFGQVYHATDRQLSEEGHRAIVAIKVLGDTMRNAADRQRLIEEATKVRRISHPNVVQVLDRGVSEDDEDFIVYEYVDGGDLSDLPERQLPLPPRTAAALLANIARGVHAAHSAGVIHCDLKPSNIMRTAAGEPKVADFGIAVRLQDRASAAAAPGSDSRGPIGNIAFISPEQFRGEDAALSVPSDVYALGGIFFYLLTARLPNGSTRNEIAQTHDRTHGRGEAPLLHSAMPTNDADLEAICRRALAPDPKGRYASASSLADDLERWLALRPIDWTRPSVVHRLRLWVRRKPALAAATAATVLAVIGGGLTTGRFASVANQRRIEAAQQRGANEFRAKIHDSVAASLQQLRNRADSDRYVTEVLMQIWVFEYMYGPAALGTPDRMDELAQRRLDVARNVLARRRAAGQGDSMEAILWEHMLAFWLVNRGDYTEAVPLIEHTSAVLRNKMPDDPWLLDMTTLRDCAEVNRLRDPSTAIADHERAASLGRLEHSLRQSEERLERDHPRTPLHYLTLNRLVDLYGPDTLNQSPDAERTRVRLRELLDDTQMPTTDKIRAGSPANAASAK
jgi:serine/threonine protein kinase